MCLTMIRMLSLAMSPLLGKLHAHCAEMIYWAFGRKLYGPASAGGYVSLVDVEIEELESFLDDDPSYLGLDMDVIEEEENYRRFLTSLLPSVDEDDNLSFLSEEDDEYHPHDDDDDVDDDEDAVDGDDIPKSELSGLLWDSSNVKVPNDTPSSSTIMANLLPPSTSKPSSSFVSIQPGAQLKGSLTPRQMAHLASQMHKHFQLLCQSMLLSPSEDAKNMLLDLQRRGDAVRQWKESVVRKVPPSTPDSHDIDTPSTSSIKSRRITRSFSAAHAAIISPSMYEIHGLQHSVDHLAMHTLTSHLGAVDFHLTNPAKAEDAKFTASEDRLLVHGVKQCSPKINWQAIQRQFLPMKTQDQLRTRYCVQSNTSKNTSHIVWSRYRFLTSAKAPENPVKDFFENVLPREKIPWLIEEELRMMRGMASFPEGERHRFAKISHSHLPHRSRQWARLLADMPEFEVDVTWSDEKQHQERLKMYLEHKKKEKEMQESIEEEAARERKATTTNAPPECTDKHLHPALFYTPWALLHPSYLLEHTCQHNWPWQASKGKHADEVGTAEEMTWRSFLSECDDDDEDSEYEQEDLPSSDDDIEHAASNPPPTSAPTTLSVEPTLRLTHLNGPHTTEKAKRTLAALERRISGAPAAAVSAPLDQTTVTVMDVEQIVYDSPSHDDDDEFECEELLPSSDDDDQLDDAAGVPLIPPTRLELLQKRMSQGSTWLP
ncbi:hypothetical protein DYB25_001813 [Aphanomyces astaci]|uniref:Myb-like domain-containing protein n=1 Tax=Aphanomyces astaci TaxID=112090 RepID=A0A397AST3_APHAT|nr:hypothetical protein DYB25_001813 [Aphanomyces astaci]RHY61763.1 hypothetical protein DYB30_001026 [Aphanomyces astaci]